MDGCTVHVTLRVCSALEAAVARSFGPVGLEQLVVTAGTQLTVTNSGSAILQRLSIAHSVGAFVQAAVQVCAYVCVCFPPPPSATPSGHSRSAQRPEGAQRWNVQRHKEDSQREFCRPSGPSSRRELHPRACTQRPACVWRSRDWRARRVADTPHTSYRRRVLPAQHDAETLCRRTRVSRSRHVSRAAPAMQCVLDRDRGLPLESIRCARAVLDQALVSLTGADEVGRWLRRGPQSHGTHYGDHSTAMVIMTTAALRQVCVPRCLHLQVLPTRVSGHVCPKHRGRREHAHGRLELSDLACATILGKLTGRRHSNAKHWERMGENVRR